MSDDGHVSNNRRSYLQSLGAVATGLALSPVVTDRGAARELDISDGDRIDPHLNDISDGDTVTIPQGTYELSGASITADNWTLRAPDGCRFVNPTGGRQTLSCGGTGWTLDGILFVNGDAGFRLNISGGDWTVTNSGFEGGNPSDDWLLTYAVTDGSTGVFNHCYFGDGAANGNPYPFAWVGYGHTGEVTFRQCHIAGFETAVYGSHTADSKLTQGVSHAKQSFFHNINKSNFKTGSDGQYTARVEECVWLFDEVPPNSNVVNPHCINGLYGDIEVRDCDFTFDVDINGQAIEGTTPPGHSYGPPSITVRGGNMAMGANATRATGADVTLHNVGSTPQREPPEGVPMSPAEAVTGSTAPPDTDSSSTQGTLLELIEDGGIGFHRYKFTVDGTIEKATDVEHPADTTDADQVVKNDDGTMTAAGIAKGGGDSYYIDGTITSMTLVEPNWTLRYGGKSTTVDELVADSSTPGTQLDKFVLKADPTVTGEPYEFTIAGDAQTRPNVEKAATEGSDTVTSNGDGTVTVSGTGGNGYADSYHISGAITSIDIDASKWTLYYNGDEVTVEDLVGNSGSPPDLPHKLTFDGSDAPDTTGEYTVGVSGSLQKADASTDEMADSVEAGAVSGTVKYGKDVYWFSGDITSLSTTGAVDVQIEDNA